MLELTLSPAYSKEPYYIGNHIKVIDKCLMSMKPTDQVARIPRKLEKNITHYKASELQMWLLFFALPCLTGVMESHYLDHLALLVEGIYILLGDDITSTDLQQAERALEMFSRDFEHLYGKNNCTIINVHNFEHLASFVQKLGPLWAWSCFPFESMNGTLLSGVHGTGDVCRQVIWRMQAQKQLDTAKVQVQDPKARKFIQRMMTVGRKTPIKVHAEKCGIVGGLHSCKLTPELELKIRHVLGISEATELGIVSKAY